MHTNALARTGGISYSTILSHKTKTPERLPILQAGCLSSFMCGAVGTILFDPEAGGSGGG
jgi:hypothetical protein